MIELKEECKKCEYEICVGHAVNCSVFKQIVEEERERKKGIKTMFRFHIYAKEEGKWRNRISAPSQNCVNLEESLYELKKNVVSHPNEFKVIIETIKYTENEYGKEIVESIGYKRRK